MRTLVVFTLLVAALALGAFFGPATGAARKACNASGGTWVTHLQTCEAGEAVRKSPPHWFRPSA